MTPLKFDMRIRRLFFDRKAVRRSVDRARRRSLSRAGAFVRQRARTSMRRRKGSAPPGKPPYAHEGSLRRLVFFAYDRGSESVFVGPVGFRKSKAPSTLEFGGRVTIKQRRRRANGKRIITSRRVRIKPRPFMAPALAREISQLPKAWRNSVKGA